MNESSTELKKSERNSKPSTPSTPLLATIAIAVLMVAGVYYWQHQQLVAANEKIEQLNAEIKTLKVSVVTLTNKVKDEPAPSPTPAAMPSPAAKAVTQADLKIAIVGTTYNDHPTCQAVTTAPAHAAINMTLTNSTTSAISLATSNLKLKDTDDNVYLPVSGAYSISSCHGGYTLLADQTIAPGETVKGALIYQVPNSSMHNFEIVNGSKSYPLTVN